MRYPCGLIAGRRAVLKRANNRRKYNSHIAIPAGAVVRVVEPPTASWPDDAVQVQYHDGRGWSEGALDACDLEPFDQMEQVEYVVRKVSPPARWVLYARFIEDPSTEGEVGRFMTKETAEAVGGFLAERFRYRAEIPEDFTCPNCGQDQLKYVEEISTKRYLDDWHDECLVINAYYETYDDDGTNGRLTCHTCDCNFELPDEVDFV